MNLTEKDVPNDSWTLREMQGYVDRLARERQYGTNVAQEMLFLTEEVGELAKAVREHIGAPFDAATTRKDLGDEFHDVLLVVFAIANLTGVNVAEAFAAKEKADLKRVWKRETP